MSDILLVTGRGTVVSSEVSHAVDHLLEMEKRLGKWEFLRKMVEMWAKLNPEMWASYTSRSENEKYRGALKKDTAANFDGSMRKLLDIPTSLYEWVAFFYPEEYTTPKFQREFARQFPMFAVPEKI